jgi:hypothetical protein
LLPFLMSTQLSTKHQWNVFPRSSNVGVLTIKRKKWKLLICNGPWLAALVIESAFHRKM